MGDASAEDFLGYLRNREILSAAEMQRLERHRAQERRSIGQALLELSLMDEATFLGHWAGMRNLAVLSAGDLEPASEAILLVPRETCARWLVLPLRSERGCLTLASSDPTNVIAEDEIRFLTGLDIGWAAAGSEEIKAAIDRVYPLAPPGLEAVPEEDFAGVSQEVSSILTEALQAGATHVHLEPTQEAFILQFRIEGTLREIRRIPPSRQPAVTTRLKILGELDIAERRLPQSGTIRLRLESHRADFAIHTLPTAFYRERITLAVLDLARPVPSPDKLGFEPELLERLQLQARSREGLILVVGPASSGRTTTLYSLGASIAARGLNVISVEERVTRPMPEFTQVEPRAGSFPLAMAVGHAQRQDSEVILLDPLGDAECLDRVLRAATAGRLVAASLWVRSLGAAVERLRLMASDSHLLAGALRAILIQRLLRTLCACKEPESISKEVASRYGLASTALFKPKGCPACHGVGFRGRTLVGHLAVADAVLRRSLESESTEASGRGEGPLDAGGLRRAVLRKVENGTTSLLEALGHLES